MFDSYALNMKIYFDKWCRVSVIYKLSGCKPLIELYEVLLRAPGVLGARFSGAGFRGCCIALVNAEFASEAASFVKSEYSKLEPELVGKITQEAAVLICESGDGARVITAS